MARADIFVREHRSIAAVDAAAWDVLSASPPASLTGSRPWVSAAFRRAHPDAVPLLLTVEARGRLVGLLPLALYRSGKTVVRFAGAPHNDMSDALVLPRYEDALTALIDVLASMPERGWTVRLEDVDPAGALVRADRDQQRFSWQATELAPTIDLHSDWRAAASRRRRSQWNRRLRRLRAEHQIEFRRVNGDDVLQQLPGFVELRRARLQAKRRDLDLPPIAFMEEVVREFAPKERCALMQMRADGHVVASDLYLVECPLALMWLRALDPRWSRFPCGHLLLRASAEDFFADGYRTLDLGRGGEPYKYVFGAERRALLEAWL